MASHVFLSRHPLPMLGALKGPSRASMRVGEGGDSIRIGRSFLAAASCCEDVGSICWHCWQTATVVWLLMGRWGELCQLWSTESQVSQALPSIPGRMDGPTNERWHRLLMPVNSNCVFTLFRFWRERYTLYFIEKRWPKNRFSAR